MADFLADTYALWALYNGSARYRPYFERKDLVTTSMNLVEFAATLLRAGRIEERELKVILSPLRGLVIEPASEVVEAAASFKASMAKARRNCSHIDAWGYATARSLAVPFLTGDEAFRSLPGVEFVKE